MPEKKMGERIPDAMTHFCGQKPPVAPWSKPTATSCFFRFDCLYLAALFSNQVWA